MIRVFGSSGYRTTRSSKSNPMLETNPATGTHTGQTNTCRGAAASWDLMRIRAILMIAKTTRVKRAVRSASPDNGTASDHDRRRPGRHPEQVARIDPGRYLARPDHRQHHCRQRHLRADIDQPDPQSRPVASSPGSPSPPFPPPTWQQRPKSVRLIPENQQR